MIVVDLACSNAHQFEGWFGSAADFEDQRARGLVSCPICGLTTVRRLPSAPHVHTGAEAPPAAPRPAAEPAANTAPAARLAEAMRMLRQMASDAENVGERLPEEARRIHYGESTERNIRGSASLDEIEALFEEGIALLPVPPAEDELH